MKSFIFSKKVEANVPKIFVLNFFMMFLLTIPIVVPYWKSLGLNVEQIFKLQAIFGLAMIILDLPMGYLSDLFGRKACLVMVGIINIVSYQILYRGKTFDHFVWFELCAALAFALYSGSDVALIYDSVQKESSHQRLQGKLLGQRVFFSQMGETIAAVLSGALATYALELPVLINTFSACLPLIIALTLVEPDRKKMSTQSHKENIFFILKSMFGHSLFLNTLIVFNIVYGLATYMAVWVYQPFWLSLGIPLTYFGLLWAASNLIVALIARQAIWLEQKMSSIVTVLIISLFPILGYRLMSQGQTFTAVFFMAFLSISRGFNSVVLQDGINARVPSEMRATANSFCSLGMRGAFIFIGPFVGKEIDLFGPHVALGKLAAIYLGIFFLVAVPLLIQLKYSQKE